MTPHADLIQFIKSLYPDQDRIALQEPRFGGNEKKYLLDCIDSTFVSSVGTYVNRFEDMVAEFTGSAYAIATVNGTAALQVALQLAGVQAGDEVITQPLSFIATCNAIHYAGAQPVFIDVHPDTLALDPKRLEQFLSTHTRHDSAGCINKSTGKRIAAVVPMHTFGLPCHLEELLEICARYGIPMVEDAAESLGSFYHGRHTGTFGQLGTLSFNGNKTITTGGGGMILTSDPELARRAKHLTTTAKLGHPYEFVHDEIGYNYRLPNLNAALGCAQMEMLPHLLDSKREVALAYAAFLNGSDIRLMTEMPGTRANYWLNAVVLKDRDEREAFLAATHQSHIMTRPVWRLLSELPMYSHCQSDDLSMARKLEQQVVNIPSSARLP